jgi:hypothetical protein
MKLLDTLFNFNNRDLRAPICCCLSSMEEESRHMGQQTNLPVSNDKDSARFVRVVREILFHNYSRCAPRLGYSNTYNNRSNLTRLSSGLSPAGTRGNHVCLNWIQNLKLLHVVPTELQRGNHCGDIKSKSELICLAKYCMLIIARKHFLLSINAFLTYSAVSNCSRTMSNLHSRYNSSHWSS